MKTRSSRWIAAGITLAGAALLTVACGSDDNVTVYDPTPPTLGTSDAAAEGAAEACGKALSIGETAPLDIVFLLDRSISMAGRKWNAVTHAVLAFAGQGFPSPTQVALSFFPFSYEGDAFGSQILTNYHACDYRLYRDFPITLGPRDTVEQRQAIETGLVGAVVNDVYGFGDGSPIYAALLGTYFTTAKLQADHPDHQLIVVLVSDGGATPCPQYPDSQTTVPVLADLAKAALEQTGVRTFAVGTMDAGLTLLQGISKAGGGDAFLAGDEESADSLLLQMQRIKNESIGCSFILPPAPTGRELDPATVDVELTSGAGDERNLTRAAGFGQCAGDASFFLDDANKPTKAILCPAACLALKSVPTTRAVVSFGCKGVVR